MTIKFVSPGIGSTPYIVILPGGSLFTTDCPGVRPCWACRDKYASIYSGLSITITGAADCDVTQTSGGNTTRVYSSGLTAWNSTHITPVKWASAIHPCTGTINSYLATVGTVTFTTVNTRFGVTTNHTCTMAARVQLEPVYDSLTQLFYFQAGLLLVIGAYGCEQIGYSALANSQFAWPCTGLSSSDIGFSATTCRTIASGCDCYSGSTTPVSPLRTPCDCLASIIGAIKLNYSFF